MNSLVHISSTIQNGYALILFWGRSIKQVMGTPILGVHSEGPHLISDAFLSSSFPLLHDLSLIKIPHRFYPLLFNSTLKSDIISSLKLVHKLCQENISSKKKILVTVLKVLLWNTKLKYFKYRKPLSVVIMVMYEVCLSGMRDGTYIMCLSSISWTLENIHRAVGG